ncbi:MAG TPA: alpha-galactosidase, partial [Bacteroidales bacterium]|nr:alpha-galactosidase [Bacteroidales bacterium]
MRTRFIFSAVLCFSLFVPLAGQKFANQAEEKLILDNDVIKRVINLNADKGGIVSQSMMLKGGKSEYLADGSLEFSFEVDGKAYTGTDKWKVVDVRIIKGELGGAGATVILDHPEKSLRISLTYLLYPGLPLVRKKIAIQNTGKNEIRIEALDIESIKFSGDDGTHTWIMHEYARQKALGPYVGECYDPVVVAHQFRNRRGIAFGNEAPGVMKRSTAFLKPQQFTTGLTHPDQNYGFRKWIAPAEQWESTWVFTAIYENSSDPFEVLNTTVSDYVRLHMGIRLSLIPKKPVFIYNTWEPFLHNINEKLIYELADAAAECGIEEFIIDDGWQDNYGDWGINKEKFPNGLKPVFDYIKSKGMKPGLWISLGAAESKSKVYMEHPEWLVRKADGTPISLHADFDKMYGWESYSMCMTTGWYDHIKGVILSLVKEHGLEYIKGDFAVATGAYTTDKTRSGCHAKDHPMHKDRNESMLEMYQRTWRLFDDLHREAPNLFIDCTFETMGALQLIDLDMCKHAEGNWLSNFSEKVPDGSLRVRNMSWWRSPVIPATAMVIGNQHFEDPEFELSLMSLNGSLPIVLGDPRKLSKDERIRMKSWADWMRKAQEKHDYMLFRQDLKGYGEPAEGNWDGYQRINSDTKSGGIVGIFRQGSPESQRTVTVKFLNPSFVYEVRKAPSGDLIMNSTGKELLQKGFRVTLDKEYDGAVFEI